MDCVFFNLGLTFPCQSWGRIRKNKRLPQPPSFSEGPSWRPSRNLPLERRIWNEWSDPASLSPNLLQEVVECRGVKRQFHTFKTAAIPFFFLISKTFHWKCLPVERILVLVFPQFEEWHCQLSGCIVCAGNGFCCLSPERIKSIVLLGMRAT